jgi:hypothetical protein
MGTNSDKTCMPTAPRVEEKDFGGHTSDSERSNVGETTDVSIRDGQDLLGQQDEDPAMSKKMHLVNNVCHGSSYIHQRNLADT